MPAWVIEPVSRIASSRRTFPGPIARSSPRSTRRVNRAVATLGGSLTPRLMTPIETGIWALVKSPLVREIGEKSLELHVARFLLVEEGIKPASLSADVSRAIVGRSADWAPADRRAMKTAVQVRNGCARPAPS